MKRLIMLLLLTGLLCGCAKQTEPSGTELPSILTRRARSLSVMTTRIPKLSIPAKSASVECTAMCRISP